MDSRGMSSTNKTHGTGPRPIEKTKMKMMKETRGSQPSSLTSIDPWPWVSIRWKNAPTLAMERQMKKVEMSRRRRRPNLSMVATVTMFPITITVATMTELRQGSTLLPLLWGKCHIIAVNGEGQPQI